MLLKKISPRKNLCAKTLQIATALFILTTIQGCKKENSYSDHNSSSESMTGKEKLLLLGFDEKSIQERESYFLVEGDIFFGKEYLQGLSLDKQAHTNELVSQDNVSFMTIFVNSSIPLFGEDNWHNAVDLAIDDWNNLPCSKVHFTKISSPTADIIISSDVFFDELPDGVIASAGFPMSGLPFNQVLVNLDYSSNEPVSEEEKRYTMVHELGHCIGLRHTNWREGREGRKPGANCIPGTEHEDPNSVMNGGAVLPWNGFSADDEWAVTYLYPSYSWLVSFEASSNWEEMASSAVPLQNLNFGDFNGDGLTDVFSIEGSQWQYSSGASSNWLPLATSNYPLENLKFGDFNGDGVTDVFTSTGSQWQYSPSGNGSWISLASSSVAIQNLRLGDFDGDGVTDVFTSYGGQWRYSSGGNTSWQLLAASNYPIANLRFGDFNGDGKTDVFSKNGNQWQYSISGQSSWQSLASSSAPLSELKFGDFNGDGRTDVFGKNGNEWVYSSGGSTDWISTGAISAYDISQIELGDFDGNGISDVLTHCPY